jgi:SulP family sulfate permease
MGIIQITAGLLRLGKFIRMVPHPVMLGFVNGLAIVIFLAQLQQFKFKGPDGNFEWLTGTPLYSLLALVILTMLITKYLPLLTRAIPSSLAAILVVTGIVLFFDLDVNSVGDLASISGGLPAFHIPSVPINLETFAIILPYACIFAAIGIIESLLTLQLIDEITETHGKSNRECIGQGAANIVTGMFGGMGGCAMIGQSMININSGGLGRLSGISAALFLLSFILFASDLIEIIPVAALVGVMFMVVLGTFEWSSFRILRKIPRTDAFVIVLVSAVTVASDLAIAVIIGVIVSALVFAWRAASHTDARTYLNDSGAKVYELHGPLFFGSIHSFNNLFDARNDPQETIIDFSHTRVHDHSGLEAIDALAERYTKLGKTLHLVHLSPECKELLVNAGDLVEFNISEDPHYHVATDRLA